MNDRLKKIVNNKYFIVVLVLLLITLVIGTGTYAWLTWSSPSTTKLTVKIGNIGDVIFDNGKEINTTGLAPVFNSNDGEKTKFSIVKRSSAASANINYTVKLNVTSIAAELKSTSFKYILLQNGEQVKSGNFSTISSGSTIELSSGTLSDTRADFTFIIYIDGNAENNSNMMGKAFKATISVTAEEDTSEKLAQHITALYNDNIDGTISNNKMGTIYNVSAGEMLMNDMKGQTADNGNIRYYGPEPNNYIYFNCDTYPNENCELWRIIGVFDGKVKIIRNTQISSITVPMNIESDDGNWKTSTVGKAFNNQEGGCQTYWNPEINDDSCSILETFDTLETNYGGFLDEVRENGLKNDTTRNMLAPFPKYNYGIAELYQNNDAGIEGLYRMWAETADTSAGDIYVGVLDIIDYAYATDFSGDCDGIQSLSDISTCGTLTWLNKQVNEFEYFMNANDYRGYVIRKIGTIDFGTDNNGVELDTNESIFRPVVYLKANVKYDSGTGAQGDPIFIMP